MNEYSDKDATTNTMNATMKLMDLCNFGALMRGFLIEFILILVSSPLKTTTPRHASVFLMTEPLYIMLSGPSGYLLVSCVMVSSSSRDPSKLYKSEFGSSQWI
ncbi:hypothetical protein OGAPHI_004125 [Ogataea philodendri]|uniref:Uncharacterized protein n=1 Tax=Ogataea philodendri TaxID=1378263 RepID=A0A9P8P6J0_9ASCO|nr:uncharacterized protein OGAPHI_004125 [Ogataea philodendri]KAH3665936.1 hypothetical protein OGAPHI_004125 [Ogataea philodendri]